jgi:hypothetical protein
MASKDKSFEELVQEAPPAAGSVSLVGTLAQSGEAGKFVLTLQDGSAITLETAAVKGHEVLGTSVGQTIVRVDVEAEKIPPTLPTPVPDIIKLRNDPGQTHYGTDIAHPLYIKAHTDKHPWHDGGGGLTLWGDRTAAEQLAPFALATPQQAALSTLAAMQGVGPNTFATPFTGIFDGWGYIQYLLKVIADTPQTGAPDNPVSGPLDRPI